jgi:hypothetical protein
MSTVPVKIQLRRDPSVVWNAANPILFLGEMGVETDTNRVKVGDGVTPWIILPYILGTTPGGIIDGGVPSSTYEGQPVIDAGGVV